MTKALSSIQEQAQAHIKANTRAMTKPEAVIEPVAEIPAQPRVRTPEESRPANPRKIAKARPTQPTTTVDRLEVEESLLHMYPQLEMRDFLPWQLWNGPVIPDFLIGATDPTAIERIVVVGCGEGLLANTLSLLFPSIEIIGVDSSKARIKRARLTIADRTNIKFMHGHPATMEPMACDRIIYDNCVGRYPDREDFKILVAKTLKWLKPNGDFIIKESPLKLATSLLFMQQAWSRLCEKPSIEHYLRSVIVDVGFANPVTYRYQKMPLLATELYYQSPRSLTLTGMTNPRKETLISEWQGNAEKQAPDNVLGYLFANQEADFSQDFA